jgi:hypothetical protein
MPRPSTGGNKLLRGIVCAVFVIDEFVFETRPESGTNPYDIWISPALVLLHNLFI